jgi:hypothetical protein
MFENMFVLRSFCPRSCEANGWLLPTPIVDLHHQVNCHARHTKKSRPNGAASVARKHLIN